MPKQPDVSNGADLCQMTQNDTEQHKMTQGEYRLHSGQPVSNRVNLRLSDTVRCHLTQFSTIPGNQSLKLNALILRVLELAFDVIFSDNSLLKKEPKKDSISLPTTTLVGQQQQQENSPPGRPDPEKVKAAREARARQTEQDIKDLKARYEETDLIDRAIKAITLTRKTARLSRSTLRKILLEWSQHPVEAVYAGLEVWLNGHAQAKKGERYLLAIIKSKAQEQQDLGLQQAASPAQAPSAPKESREIREIRYRLRHKQIVWSTQRQAFFPYDCYGKPDWGARPIQLPKGMEPPV